MTVTPSLEAPDASAKTANGFARQICAFQTNSVIEASIA
jgi:hypothetical protein